MRRFMAVVAVCLAAASAAHAGDAAKGKAKAAVCGACHGANGISVAPIYPNLAGQKEQYLAAQLKAFKTGERNNPIMAPQAKTLSDGDIANLAAYFSSLSGK